MKKNVEEWRLLVETDYEIDGRWGHLPSMASFTLDKKLIEANGLIPDIQLDLDVTLFNSTGQDTQLDRALQYISTGQ